MDEPRKVNPEAVEVIGAQGEVIKEAKDTLYESKAQFGNIKVFKGGPWLLLLVPVLIPIAVVMFFFLALLALLFGRSIFKVAMRGVRRS